MKNIKWAKFSAFQMTIEALSVHDSAGGAHCAPPAAIVPNESL